MLPPLKRLPFPHELKKEAERSAQDYANLVWPTPDLQNPDIFELIQRAYVAGYKMSSHRLVDLFTHRIGEEITFEDISAILRSLA